MQNKVSAVPEEDLRFNRHRGGEDSSPYQMSPLREDSQAGMADTDLIENEIMFTPDDERAWSKKHPQWSKSNRYAELEAWIFI